MNTELSDIAGSQPSVPGSPTPSATASDSAASVEAVKDVPMDETEETPLEEAIETLVDPHVEEVQKFMAAAQNGNVTELKEMIDSGTVTVNETLEDNVSALHWCAINNKLKALKYLVSKGGDVDAVGGDLNSTPVQWAARYGLVYVVDYLIRECHANETIKDAQGFNLLHLSVLSSNIMMVIYITKFTDLDLDEPDPKGRTALHWAAYQGDVLTVEYLLQLRPAVNLQDEQGFTPLHWCLVRQAKSIMIELLNAGADAGLKTNDGKSCWDVARDMNCVGSFRAALSECYYTNKMDQVPQRLRFAFSKQTAKEICFFAPYFTLGLALWLVSSGILVFRLILALFIFGLQFIVLGRWVIPVFNRRRHPIMHTPFFAGVFSATLFWCVSTWAVRFLPYTFAAVPFRNFVLLVGATFLTYCFAKSMSINPGYIPRETNVKTIQTCILQLLELRKFDARNFCIYTMIRRPLRSKYSRIQKANVARFDHYCPWVFNDVGVRNHKLFYGFIVSLMLTLFMYLWLASAYFASLDVPETSTQTCILLSQNLCRGYYGDRFIFCLSVWSTFQSFWLTMLVISQTFQISMGCTTYEFGSKNSNRKRESSFSSVPTDEPKPEDESGESRDTSGSSAVRIACLPPAFFNSRAARVLGIKQFMLITKDIARRRHTRQLQQNPYDYGFVKNWLNFLFIKRDGEGYSVGNLFRLPNAGESNLGDELVDYYRLYTSPINPKYSRV